METLFIYFGKVILSSGVMFTYYQLFLKDKTFHHYNRFYLLSAMLLSLVLPLIKVSYFTIELNNNIYLLFNKIQNFNTSKIVTDDYFYFKIIAFVFGLVSVFFLAKFFIGLFKINQLKGKFSKENFEGISFYQTNLESAPFSYFKNLFWKNSIAIDSEVGRQILKHEMVHIEQKHSWDKIFVEILTSLLWFNPFFYLIKKEINLIHEYLADKKALKNSDTKAFAQMLLASHFSGKQLPATSPFLSSNLKKRLTMLKKSKTKFSYARRILALPLLFALAFIYLVNAKNKEISKTNLEIEKMVANIKQENNSATAIQRDTIKTKDSAYGTDGTEVYSKNPELFADHDSLNESSLKLIQNQISIKQKQLEPYQKLMLEKSSEGQKISKDLRIKSEELQKLSLKKDYDNPKFKALEKEMDELGAKLDRVYDSEDYKNSQKLLDKNYGDLDQLYAKLDQYYNSDAFTSKIKAAEKAAEEADRKVNSPEFKKMIKDAEEQGKKAEKMVNSPKFKKMIKDAEKKGKEAEKLVNSAEFKKQIKEIELKASEFSNATSNIVFLNNNKNSDSSPVIYIDGKLATEAEMKALSPDSIKNMYINKNKNSGKAKSEIRITTKK